MDPMNELERALEKARGRDYDRLAAEAATRLAPAAEREGLVDVAYTAADSPVGEIVLATTRRGLVRIAFGDFLDRDQMLEDLGRRVSPRILEAPARLDDVRRQLDEYFSGRRTSFELPLDWSLTRGFNRLVLQHTARIPYGDVSTYGAMATAAGSPRAARAAGNALGSNPIPIVVPCHRVLHTGGGLGGYGGGLDRKEFLLKLEGAR
jgi:methylated-DNA-[protein]-cysteine S-methyltransferase